MKKTTLNKLVLEFPTATAAICHFSIKDNRLPLMRLHIPRKPRLTSIFVFIFQCESKDPIKVEKEKEKRRERVLIYKNVLLISLAFLLLFVAFDSMSKLQSSINTVRRFSSLSSQKDIATTNGCNVIFSLERQGQFMVI